MYTLGIWDGHDAGISILEDDKILFAINEERLTNRKLDVGFPQNSLKFALSYLKLKPSDIDIVATSTSDIGKTNSRYFPGMAKNYYMFRRRKIEKPLFEDERRKFKYFLTESGPNPVSRFFTETYYRQKLSSLGFKDYKFHLIDHHAAHAASAAFSSGMKKQIVVTIDGVGDGISSTVSVFKNNEIERIAQNSGRDSLGLFYEQVTNLMGMRELEDEGKVMALSNYAIPVPDEKNRLMKLFDVDGLRIRSSLSTISRYDYLKKAMWNIEREEFAYMAQRTLEKNVQEFVGNAIDETGIKNVSVAGGVASNIKANMFIKDLAKEWFVFPHMGDGGLAMGCAMQANQMENSVNKYDFTNLYYGPEYEDSALLSALKKHKMKFEIIKDAPGYAGEQVSDDKIGFWFQGRMEYGPRALGNRSIITSATNKDARIKLNMSVKNRNWFQPFCPSVLSEEAGRFFEGVDRFDRFMTMGYHIKPEYKDVIVAIKNVDDTARPQMLVNENPKYRQLIETVKKITGNGIILNTSLNMHGSPLVNTPEEAVLTFKSGQPDFMIMGDYLVQKR